MDSPQTALWGPALWNLLHFSTERVGSRRLHRLPHEEARIWSHLLSRLAYSLPCPQCKKHYQLYLSTHPLSVSTKEELRRWLWRLHEEVNQRTGKASTVTLEEVEGRYSVPFAFSSYASVVLHHMRLAVQRGWCAREDVVLTGRFLEEMRRFYDFF